MKRNDRRIRTSHGGNLPLPTGFDAMLATRAGERAATRRWLTNAVEQVVDRQIQDGIDVVNDGEYIKAGDAGAYAGYIHDRVTGWEHRPADSAPPPKRGGPGERDRRDFPGFYASGLWLSGSGGSVRPGFATPGKKPERRDVRVCVAPVRYVGEEAIAADIDALQTALRGKDAEGFIAALGPLSLGAGAINEHYSSEEEYMLAVAEVGREEYRRITDAGLIVQIDEPEFLTTWMFNPDWDLDRYRKYLQWAVEVINHSLEGIPEEQVRFHSCWGSGHRPHTNDIELTHVVDLLIQIKAQCYSIESGNVRHAHEWRVWKDVSLPAGKMIMPGVVSHATDLVEHPELVAERLVNFGEVVGRENVQAGTDCGIGSRVGHEEVAWAKLQALTEGAALASERMWHR